MLRSSFPAGSTIRGWDFSPKEETDRIPIRNWRYAVIRIVGKWWEELCWFFAVMTVWGLVAPAVHPRPLPGSRPGRSRRSETRLLLIVFAAVYALALVRHSVLLGYLSGRHIMALVYASLPWAAAGTFVCARGIAVKLHWSRRACRIAGSRGRQPARRGLDRRADATEPPESSEPVGPLGGRTSGWRTTPSRPSWCSTPAAGPGSSRGMPGYDYWHVRQALTDSHLSYIIVGLDELEAMSPRARTLKALLSYAATPLKDFPAFPGDRTAGVRLYRFHRPSTWEGLVP